MLFKSADLDGIALGRITLAYRRWKRPTVKAGGSLDTRVGRLAIDSVETVEIASITKAEARRAGYASVGELRRMLPGEEPVNRIGFHLAGPVPRIALRLNQDAAAIDEVLERLVRMDGAAPWTIQLLDLIAANAGRRAGDLAPALGWDTPRFKTQVRRLKALGLTESLEVGYRLSPRGRTVLVQAQLSANSAAASGPGA